MSNLHKIVSALEYQANFVRAEELQGNRRRQLTGAHRIQLKSVPISNMKANVFLFAYMKYEQWNISIWNCYFLISNGIALVPVDQIKLHRLLLLLLCVWFYFWLLLWTQMDYVTYWKIEKRWSLLIEFNYWIWIWLPITVAIELSHYHFWVLLRLKLNVECV